MKGYTQYPDCEGGVLGNGAFPLMDEKNMPCPDCEGGVFRNDAFPMLDEK